MQIHFLWSTISIANKMQATLLSVFKFVRQGHARLTVAPPEAIIPVSPLNISSLCVHDVRAGCERIKVEAIRSTIRKSRTRWLWSFRFWIFFGLFRHFTGTRITRTLVKNFARTAQSFQDLDTLPPCFCSIQVKAVRKTSKKTKNTRRSLKQSSPRHQDSLDSGGDSLECRCCRVYRHKMTQDIRTYVIIYIAHLINPQWTKVS